MQEPNIGEVHRATQRIEATVGKIDARLQSYMDAEALRRVELEKRITTLEWIYKLGVPTGLVSAILTVLGFSQRPPTA